MMTLASLNAIRSLINVVGVAKAIDMHPQTLHARLREGKPELSVTESLRLDAAFRAAGLLAVPTQDQTP